MGFSPGTPDQVVSNFSSTDPSGISFQASYLDRTYATFTLNRVAYEDGPGGLPGLSRWAISLRAECGVLTNGVWTPCELKVRVFYTKSNSDEVHSTDWTTMESPDNTYTFNLEELEYPKFKKISLQFRFETSSLKTYRMYVYEAKLHYVSNMKGGEIRITPDETSLLGNVNIVGHLDGYFDSGVNFEESLRKIFNRLYVSDINTSLRSRGTWHKNESTHPMIIMYTNSSTSGSISLRDDTGETVYEAKAVKGAVDGQGSGWGSYTAICPHGWSYMVGTEGNSRRFFTCLLRI